MKIREPISHWNNFTISELKDILKHCAALESLGIAQDQEMVASIERDIALREKNQIPAARSLRKTAPRAAPRGKNRPQVVLIEQTA